MRKPNPSLVIACLALAIALGGTAYAASLPRNSVGSPQVKANSLKGIDIKESTLKGVMRAEGVGSAGSKLLGSNSGGPIVTIPKVGRIEGVCSVGVTSAQVRFFNATNAAATDWFEEADGTADISSTPPHATGVPHSTSLIGIRTWVIHTTAPKRLTVVTVANFVAFGSQCEFHASVETMPTNF